MEKYKILFGLLFIVILGCNTQKPADSIIKNGDNLDLNNRTNSVPWESPSIVVNSAITWTNLGPGYTYSLDAKFSYDNVLRDGQNGYHTEIKFFSAFPFRGADVLQNATAMQLSLEDFKHIEHTAVLSTAQMFERGHQNVFKTQPALCEQGLGDGVTLDCNLRKVQVRVCALAAGGSWSNDATCSPFVMVSERTEIVLLKKVPVYINQNNSGDYIFSRDINEGVNLGYSNKGSFLAFDTQGADTKQQYMELQRYSLQGALQHFYYLGPMDYVIGSGARRSLDLTGYNKDNLNIALYKSPEDGNDSVGYRFVIYSQKNSAGIYRPIESASEFAGCNNKFNRSLIGIGAAAHASPCAYLP